MTIQDLYTAINDHYKSYGKNPELLTIHPADLDDIIKSSKIAGGSYYAGFQQTYVLGVPIHRNAKLARGSAMISDKGFSTLIGNIGSASEAPPEPPTIDNPTYWNF